MGRDVRADLRRRSFHAERLQGKIALVRMLYERGYTKEDILELFRFIDWVEEFTKFGPGWSDVGQSHADNGTMRLSEYEIDAIKDAIRRHDKDAVIYVFGSRVDDTRKGGDIDLLIISSRLSYADKLRIRQAIEEKIGERKIDIVIASDLERPFVKMGVNEGVLL